MCNAENIVVIYVVLDSSYSKMLVYDMVNDTVS